MFIKINWNRFICISAVWFQALLTYCMVQAPIILGEDIFERVENNEK